MNDLDWTRLVNRITPAPDGEKPVRHRTGTVTAINPDTTVDLDLGGQIVEDVRVIGGTAVDDIVQVLVWEGDLLVLGRSASGEGIEPFPLGSIMMWPSPTPPDGWLVCNGSAVSRTDYAPLFAAIGTTYGAGDGSTTFNLPNLQGRFPIGVGTLGSDTYALADVGGAARVALVVGNLPPHVHGQTQHTHGVGTLSAGNNDASHQHPMGHTHATDGSFIADVVTTGSASRLRETGSHTTGTSSIANTGNQSGPHSHSLAGSTANSSSSVVTGDGSSQGLESTAHENRPPFLALHFIILYNPEFKGFGSGGTGAGVYLPLAGGTMTGDITLAGDPDQPLEPVTLQYLQTHYLPLSGGTMTGPLILNNDPTLPMEAATKQYVDASGGGGGGGVNPTGVILPFGGATPPAGYLLCDGAAISRTTYAALFSVLGTAYGAGDGTATFNVPDLRGRFPLGKADSGTGSTLGAEGGSLSHTHTGPSHTHTTPNHVHDLGASAGSGILTTNTQGAHTHEIPAGTNTSNESHSHTFSDTASGSDSFTTGGPSSTGSQQFDPGTTSYALSGHTHSGSVSISITVSGTTSAHSHNHHVGGIGTNSAGNHTHGIATHTHDLGNSASGGGGSSGAGGTGATGAANPPYQVVNYIVKT